MALIFLGTIPFGFGVVFGVYSVFGGLCATMKWLLSVYGVKEVLLGTTPHAGFELSALFLSVLLSVLWCRIITLSVLCFVRRRPRLSQFKHELLFLAKAIGLILLPLLLIAAFIEVAITPQIMEMLN
jgi:uncharacterized membrane protein SpoIIM required for sporulation